MTIVNYFDHHDRKAAKEHFLHLIQVANADGVIDEPELKMLHKVGKNLGLTDPEIDSMIESKESKVFNPPYELEKRFHILHDVVAMALADGVLYESEKKLIRKLAIASSFNEVDTEHLVNLLINGIKYGKKETELLETFKSRK
jgi:uncharacterized tellurite resistance protein B-like protein